MRRLIRWRPGRRRRSRAPDDHGAVAAVVAIMLGGGVLLGMGALVIDVGRLYAERERLQSGADAASWQAAESCVARPASCTNALQATGAGTIAQRNAEDGRADAQICLSGTVCPAWRTTVTCRPLPAAPGSYAEVRTTTRNADGTGLLPPSLAGAVVGPSYQGKTVGACARVNWGPPATVRTLALGISRCDWARMTNSGTSYHAIPGISPVVDQAGVTPVLDLPTATAGTDSAVINHVPLLGLLPNCTTPLNGTPRGYAWMGTPDAACRTTVTAPAWLPALVPLGATATACAGTLVGLRANRRAVLVPIFDQAVGVTALLGSYHVVGYAAFVVTGYTGLLGGLLATLSSLSGGTVTGAPALCGAATCLYGYFTRMLIPTARPAFSTTNTDYGVTTIGRTG